MEQVARILASPPYNLPYTRTLGGEYAWHSGNYPEIMQFLREKKYVILGGDILTTGLQYTYENWYYNPDPRKPEAENARRSAEVTELYFSDLLSRFKEEFLIVFVLQRRFP